MPILPSGVTTDLMGRMHKTVWAALALLLGGCYSERFTGRLEAFPEFVDAETAAVATVRRLRSSWL